MEEKSNIEPILSTTKCLRKKPFLVYVGVQASSLSDRPTFPDNLRSLSMAALLPDAPSSQLQRPIPAL